MLRAGWGAKCRAPHEAPGTARSTRHLAPRAAPGHPALALGYEQFAETILSDVTFSVGIDDAGVAVPRSLALDEPGADDDPGEVDEPGRSAVALWSVVPEPVEPDRPAIVVPVIWTLWFTCWLRFTPELPADRMNVLPAARLLLDALELGEVELGELLELAELLSADPPCSTLVRMY